MRLNKNRPKQIILYKMESLGVGVEDKMFVCTNSSEKIQFSAALKNDKRSVQLKNVVL